MGKRLQKLQLRAARYRRVRWPRHARQLERARQHPSFRVPLITFGVLLLISGIFYGLARQTNNLPPVHDSKIVIISHDGHHQTVPSKEATVGALLTKLNIKINQGDVVEPAQTAKINQDQFRINIYRAKPVEIVDGASKTYTFSAATTGRAISQQVGITVYPEDIAKVDPVQNFIKDGAVGQQVVIDRATPVNTDLYGTNVVLRTHAKTIAGLMKEKHINVTKNDHVVPDPSTPITPGQQVSFIRTGTKVETVTEDIAMPIQAINDNSLAYGTAAIRQQGTPGQRVVTYQIELVNNVEKARAVIQQVVTRQPVTQIEVVGTSLSGIKGDMALAGIAPGDYQYADYIISHESGWCPTKAQGEHYCPPIPDNSMTPNGYGLCQATPGHKMSTAGADWATNPITQLRWCSNYASRYGGWAGAYNHWLSYHSW